MIGLLICIGIIAILIALSYQIDSLDDGEQ
jgi:hypothetical protein